jgi:ribosomal protein S12 methylthiotransferase accessory factor
MSHRIVLKDAYKGYTHDQDKLFPPEETIRRFKERLQNVDLNILESTVRIDNGRLNIPVFFSVCGKDAAGIIGTKKQMGKGGTPQQAEASAVMELAERFSFFSFLKDRGDFFTDEYRNLKEKALPFETIALSVHDNSGDLDMAKDIFSMTPLKWTWAYNLTRQEEILIPFDWFFTINEFNGSSAGNCAEEALIQGICEVMERHVSAIIDRNRLETDSIDTDSLNDPLSLEMIKKYREEGIRLFLKDFSLDTGIPTAGALAYDPSTFPSRSEIIWTAGTAPNPQKALNRALAEVAQLAGDFNSGSNYVASGLHKFRSLDEAAFVTNPGRTVDINHMPDLSNDNIKAEIINCVSCLSEKGMEIIAVNISHPILDIPAFYTIISGALFRQRATAACVGMYLAKLISNNPDPEWSIHRLKEMDQIMPGKYYVKFFLGICHLSMNEPAQALRYLEDALRLDPEEEDISSVYSYMGQCLKEMHRYRDAIAVLEEAEKYDHERTDIYNLMGFCRFKLKEHEKAIECFKNVLRLDATSAVDYANIASNYRDMGDKEQAVHYYMLALDIDPTIEFARNNLEKLRK